MMSLLSASAGPIDWLSMGLGFLAGLVLFIYSVTLLSDCLKEVGGDQVKNILSRFTTNRYTGVLTGAVATIAIGSSSITIITVIAMVNAGLLSFVQSLGVVMGSNIGTTFSSQIFALDAEKYAPLVLLIGFVLKMIHKQGRWHHIGMLTFSLGMVFFSLGLLGDSMSPLKDYAPFRELLKTLESPWTGVLIGAGFTALIQSSSATMGIVIVLASQGMMTLPAAVSVMLGAEIGTCGNTLIATINRSRHAIRTGVFHLLFNIVTVILGVILVEQIIAFTNWISGEASLQRKIANAHMIFNIGGVLLVVGFSAMIARGLFWLIPQKKNQKKQTLA
ncbi:MAG: Na/Pi cotransporter family protein [Cyclobacteriaceae bacterium]